MRFLLTKCVLSLLLVLFWTNTLFGQVQEDVKKVLLTKDFVAFQKFADSLADSGPNSGSYWYYLRDLTPDFKEGIFMFREIVQNQDNSAIISFNKFRVTMIIKNNEIVYCDLGKQDFKKEKEDFEEYYISIYNFRDKKQFTLLRSSFKSILGTDLNETELFVTDFVYGNYCGPSGTKPDGQEQIAKWVKRRNKVALLKWLKSTNTEKQIYAVEGLFQLKKAGVKFTNNEFKIIRFVINKRGDVHTCFGCNYDSESIRNVTSKFTF